MPTAAAAYFEFDINDWEEVKPETGELKFILRPKELS